MMTEEKGRDPHETEKIVRLIEQDLTRLWKHVMKYYRRFPCESFDDHIQNYGSATFGIYKDCDDVETVVARLTVHDDDEENYRVIYSRLHDKLVPEY